ncbi:MAG: 50S ribosomal protein L15 [Brevinematales bacterium]|nr:50S ribosomal protein L15 [Brevinematales bacterium]
MSVIKLNQPAGAVKKAKRVGRGIGNGRGRYCGKGQKGQKARSGGGVRIGFEGGQMPLYRRLPKRGFKNIDKVFYRIINVSQLEVFKANEEVTIEKLEEKGLVKKANTPVKLLGNGDLKVKGLKVSVNAISASAKEKIEKLGGSVNLI